MDRPSTNDENDKKTPARIHGAQNEQADFDYALAMVLQEQETTLRLLATLESTDEDESDVDDEDDDFFVRSHDIGAQSGFQGQEDESELGFLLEDGDEETEDDGEEMEEDDIDPDELSYEELMTLGEIVGQENKGLSQVEIDNLLCPCTFQIAHIGSKMGIDRCVICQVEYAKDEILVALPCEHPYHAGCISKWLQLKKICPICTSEVSPPPWD